MAETDPAALVAVDLPARIDHGLHDRLKSLGLPVHDLSPLYLVKAQRDLTWVETPTGEIRCGPSDLIVYDPRTDRLTVMDAALAGNRYAPIATATPAERDAAGELEHEEDAAPALNDAGVDKAPPTNDEPTIVPTGEGVE